MDGNETPIVTKVKIVQVNRKYVIKIDDKDTTLKKMRELTGLKSNRLYRILRKDDRETILKEHILKLDRGVCSKAHTYWHEDRPMWASIVMDIAGVCRSHAGKRLAIWMKDGDDKRLFTTTKGQKGPARGSVYAKSSVQVQKELGATVKKRMARRSPESLKPPGTWEMENL